MELTLNERIRGFIFGTAIGDALGLGTEFMTKPEARMHYPDGLRSYGQIIRDAHRKQWKRGSWTNDTDVVLALAESMITCNGPDYMDYARRLKEWYLTDPTDLISHLRWVLKQDDYLDDPIGVCRRVVRQMRRFEGSNEALGRAALIGLWPGDQSEAALNNCRLTHADTRCAACAVLLAKTASAILWEDRVIGFDEACAIANDIDETLIPYLETAHNGNISDFVLDDEDTYWYTRKATGAAMWALWHDKTPQEALEAIVDEAGDADTNSSLAMSLTALRHGLGSVSPQLIEGLEDKEILEDMVNRLTAAIESARN